MTAGSATKIAGAAALITVLTVVARIAGFARTFVFLHTVGHGGLSDIYNAANTIPNIVFELVAGGALASLVVPLLAAHVAAGDRERVGAVASALLTWVLVLLVPLAVLVAVLAGPIAGLLPDVPADHQQIAASMLRVFAPQLPLYGAGIVLTGVLQAHHRFAWPVIAPLLSSVTVMAAYSTYAVVDGAKSDFPGLSRTGELTLSAGTTAGVVVLALCLLIPLRKLRLRFRPALRFPGDEGRQAVRLGWAGAVTVGSQQIMVVVVVALSARSGLTLYNAAQTVFLLPWAVLAVPLATAVYPTLAAAASGTSAASRTAAAGSTSPDISDMSSTTEISGAEEGARLAEAGPAAAPAVRNSGPPAPLPAVPGSGIGVAPAVVPGSGSSAAPAVVAGSGPIVAPAVVPGSGPSVAPAAVPGSGSSAVPAAVAASGPTAPPAVVAASGSTVAPTAEAASGPTATPSDISEMSGKPDLQVAGSSGEEAYRAALSGSARTIVLLAGLGAAALAALAGPAAYLIDAAPAASGIVGFAPGLFGYALFALLSRALYARGATRAAAASTAAGWIVAAMTALVLAGPSQQHLILKLGVANATGMTVIGVLLVVAVRRTAGAAALAGLGRATTVGIVAAGLAALAGWGVVAGVGQLVGDRPSVGGSLVQGVLGGIAVLVVFGAVAYPLARQDLRRLARRGR